MSEPAAPRDQRGRRRRGRGRDVGRERLTLPQAASRKAVAAREAVSLATIAYPPDLPVSARRDDIAAAIREHQVVIVAGETGSGKTTQLPKIALELGRGRAGLIGHTQPRRIAARSVAERIAEELQAPLGDVVGYQVRFTDHSSERTLVKVMTDGILLAQIQHDPDLLAYDTLIIDEAHERSLNIDFLLGYLTTLLPRRPDLRLVITSATIDSERFAAHFADADGNPAPVIEVTGRTYPVEIRYRPLVGETKGEDRDLYTGIVEACDELMREGPGDILVFLSGEREIRDAADALAGHLGPRVRDPKHPQAVELLPLYSRLSAAEQHRVFQPHSARRIVLATNVAETSLTVPGIHYVVDPGLARISRYSKATKVQRLPIEPISQASANQRAGRAGRIADGIAIRLYSQEDFEGRPAFTEPEILRTSLASVLLQMIAVGVVDGPDAMLAFPFVEPPDTRAVRDGMNLLSELGAIESRRGATVLTDIGRTLARLPMDPRQARMIVEAARHGVAREVAIIAAALSIQDPRERPAEQREAAELLHRRFADPTSDFLTYLNLWEYLRAQRKALSGSAFRRLVRSEHLNYLRIREWQDVVEQIREAAKGLGIEMRQVAPRRAPAPAEDSASPVGSLVHLWNDEAIHRSILAGLLSHIGSQDVVEVKASSFTHLKGDARASAMRKARKGAANEYLGARGARFAIIPSSPLSKKPPEFVMAAELVETNRLWARDVAAIKAEWAEELAAGLVKRTYSEPRWSKRRGAAVATEKVLLYGVPIVADRTVLWGCIDPVHAREMFIREALIGGEWETRHRFWAHNQRVIAEAEELEARSRTRGLLLDDEALFSFYDDRLPATVISAAHFDKWWREAKKDEPHLLSLDLEELLPAGHEIDPSLYPDAWPHGDLTLPVTYQFEPGLDADGVTVHIPLAVLPAVRPTGFDWLVPGMRHELITSTIRALPKHVRRLLVPAPDTARAVEAWMAEHLPPWDELVRREDAPSFRSAFTDAARAVKDVEVPADAWDEVDDRLPAHVRVTFRVVAAGKTLDEASDLVWLQRKHAPAAAKAVRAAVAPADRAKPAPAGKAAAASRDGEPLTAWPTRLLGAELPGGTLPHDVSRAVAGATVRGYPGLAEEKGKPVLTIHPDAALRDAAHPAGVRRLLLAQIALPVKRVTTRWTGAEALTLASSPYPSTDALVADLQLAAVTALTSAGGPRDAGAIRDLAAYEALRDALRPLLEDEVHRLARLAVDILSTHRTLDAEVRATNSMAMLGVVSEIRSHASSLVGEGFLSRTPADRLPHLPRYLEALRRRLASAPENMSRDAQLAWQMDEARKEYEATVAALAQARPDPVRDRDLDDVKWLLEELRVSLWAQQLGTPVSVSPQRIRKALAAIPRT